MTVRVKPLSGSAQAITDYPLRHVQKIDAYYLAGSDPLGPSTSDGPVNRRLDEWERTEWFGVGADRLGLSGALTHATFGAVIRGVHPETGELLGRAFQEKDNGGSAPSKRAFDATFSAPKSVSLAWAFADEPTRREFHAGHVAAVKAVLGEVEVQARTRYRLPDQSLVCVDAQGLAVGLAHQFTSRTGDPQIHTHAIISAKVQAPDGRWLALDARALMADQQCWSRLYHAALEAELTRRLGVEWGPQTGAGHREMVGVDRDVIDGFSRRTAQAEAAIQQKMSDFKASVGRDPNPNETWKLHREAVVETRPAKQGDLADGFERWAAQLSDEYGIEPDQLIANVVGRNMEPGRHAPEAHDVTAQAVLAAMGEQQSAWRPNQLLRDVARDTVPSAATAVEMVTELKAAVRRVIEHRCVPVHELDPGVGVVLPPAQAPLPPSSPDEVVGQQEKGRVGLEDPASGVPRRLSDGRPVTTHALDELYTTDRIVEQEQYLTAWADQRIEPVEVDVYAEPVEVAPVEIRPYEPVGVELDLGQRNAAAAIASQRGLVLVEGPAGTGKTTMLATAVAYLHDHGQAVYGYAPSAAAAQELAASTGLQTDTLAKLLWEHTVRDQGPSGPYRLPAGATVIIDEAGMVATNDLHTLARLADTHRWNVVLVGDGHQLSAVGRGGMFDCLVTSHPGDVQRLGVVQRFTEPWERDASLALRRGRMEALDTYQQHHRFTPATGVDDAIRQATGIWHHNNAEGRRVLITAATNETVSAVNTLIQKRRLEQFDIGGTPVTIDGAKAYVADVVTTRRNDRDLTTDRGITVANRHTFEVAATHTDGSITVAGKTGTVTLPATYAREHVQLAYATTAHGAQGRTVDRAVTIVEPATDHAGLYVALTRGRTSNTAIVPVDETRTQTPVDVLAGVLRRDWADTPAHTQAAEIRTRQNIDIPASSILRTPATAVRQTGTVQPANKIRLLEPDLLRRFLDEQATLTAEIRFLPGRIADSARRLDSLNRGVEELQQTATEYRDRIARNQEQLDSHLERGVLHRTRYAKTIQSLETATTTDQQRLAAVEQNISVQQDPQRRQATQLAELQRRQTDTPERLQKISALIDTDRDARLENVMRTRKMPRDVAEAIAPLGRRQDQPEHHRKTWDRRVGDALQHHAAHGEVSRVEPIQQPAQRIERRGPSLGR